MISDLAIRKLKPEESGAYRQIRLECLKLHPDAFFSKYETEVVKPLLRYEEHIKNGSDRDFTLGAFVEQQLVGICSVQIKPNNDLECWQLIQMYVRKAHRREGIGSELIRRVLDVASERGADIAEISVFDRKNSAFALYRNLGFMEARRDQSPSGVCITLRYEIGTTYD